VVATDATHRCNLTWGGISQQPASVFFAPVRFMWL